MRWCPWAIVIMTLTAACEGDPSQCSTASECIDGDICTDDRCTNEQCTYLPIVGCCKSNADCDAGDICHPQTHQCDPEAACATDDDCDDQDDCTLDRCDPSEQCQNDQIAECPFPLGESCQLDGQCQSGTCFTEEVSGFPGGFCSQLCTDQTNCGAHAACRTLMEQLKFCSPTCTATSECRGGQGYLCYKTLDFNDPGLCIPHCMTDADCPATGACENLRGLCHSSGVGSGIAGAPCESTENCGGYCLTEAFYGAPGGICTSFCSLDQVGCPGTDRCVLAWTNKWPSYPICLPLYDEKVKCRDHYAPLISWELPGMNLVATCQPACTSGSCLSATSCNQWTGMCDHQSGGEGVTGAPCTDNADCLGLCLQVFPNGYCSSPCSAVSPDCPGDGLCVSYEDMRYCAAPCINNSDCREADGYICMPDGYCSTP